MSEVIALGCIEVGSSLLAQHTFAQCPCHEYPQLNCTSTLPVGNCMPWDLSPGKQLPDHMVYRQTHESWKLVPFCVLQMTAEASKSHMVRELL
eukprot:3813681-Amphidinium_carterae.1